jgi:hypothetical protein
VDVQIDGTWNSHREAHMNAALWWLLICAGALAVIVVAAAIERHKHDE